MSARSKLIAPQVVEEEGDTLMIQRVGRKKERVAKNFTFRELAAATKGFKEVNLIGEVGFGKVFKGRLEAGQEIMCDKQILENGFVKGDEQDSDSSSIHKIKVDRGKPSPLSWQRKLNSKGVDHVQFNLSLKEVIHLAPIAAWIHQGP